MSRARGPLAELRVVAEYEIKALLFGVRSILLLVVYGGTAAAFGGFYLWASKRLEQKLIEQNPALAGIDKEQMIAELVKSEQFQTQIGPMLERMGGTQLLDAVAQGEMPGVLLVVLLLSTFVLPGLVLLVGYDRISDDLSTKYARFVLQRVRRKSYLIGKWLGHWAVVMLAVIAAHLLLVVLGWAAVDDFEAKAALLALPRVWIGMAVLLLAYTAFSAVFSSSIAQPFLALAIGAMALMGLWFLSLGPLHGIWMGTWDMGLWVLDSNALAVFLGHAVLFAGGAFACLRWRDV